MIPVNITYYPMRAQENVFLSVARGMVRDLSKRAIEELAVEGSVLSKDTDIDITLGEPIDVGRYLDAPEYAAIMACGDRDLKHLEEDPGSLFGEAAQRLMIRYMGDIYRMATINHEHIFAALARYQLTHRFTRQGFRERAFLAAREIAALGAHHLHEDLAESYPALAFDEPCPQLEAFLQLCLQEGTLTARNGGFARTRRLRGTDASFHDVRKRALTYVIANEVEPLPLAKGILRNAARMPQSTAARRLRDTFRSEDLRLFDQDYAEFAIQGESKPPEVGRPFLLVPRRIRGGIVLTHGYMAAPLEVRALADHLCGAGFAVYGVRLRGHGTAPEDLAGRRWEEWCGSVNRGYAIVKTLTRNVIFGGFSMGGTLALLMGARKGANARAVFSICAPPGTTELHGGACLLHGHP